MMAIATLLERMMLGLVNSERTSRGLDPLKLETHLNSAADGHSAWMLQADVFSHEGVGGTHATERIRAADFDLTGLWKTGENVAISTLGGPAGYDDEVRSLHELLMQSEGHRANILDPDFDYVGIGIQVGQFEFDAGVPRASLTITQNFARTEGEVSLQYQPPAQVPGEVIHATRAMARIATGSGDDTVYGSTRSATIELGGGEDRFVADNGVVRDKVYGNSGNDSLYGRGGNDWFRGGSGNDRMKGGTGSDWLRGESGNDNIDGGSSRDTLYGDTGHDALYGGGGSDLMLGGPGNDKLVGHSGNDRLIGGSGSDRIFGDSGRDKISGDHGYDKIWGGSGNDWISAGADSDIVWSGSGNDTVAGGSGHDRIWGGPGHDRLKGDNGSDDIRGSSGNDLISGGAGKDILRGESGNDRIWGGTGADRIFLGSGNDTFYDDGQTGRPGADRVLGQEGNDRFVLGGGDNVITGGTGRDRYYLNRPGIGDGDSLITDFSLRSDSLAFHGHRSALDIHNSSKGLVIDWGAGEITLRGLDMGDLTSLNLDFI